MKISLKLLLVFMLTIFFTDNIALFAQETYVIQKATLTVYRDGVVHVSITLLVDEYEPLIALPLLSPPDSVDNIIVLDEKGSLLLYNLSEGNIIIYSLGSTKVTVEYDTDGLTYKAYGLWTINFTAPFELTLILPENATVMYLSSIPLAIRLSGWRLEMDLSPGNWKISYEIPIGYPPVIPPSKPSDQQIVPLPREYITAIVVSVSIVCIVALAAAQLRRRSIKALSDDEANIIRFLKKKGGRALEAELRESFPHIPKTTMWRLIKRLEKQGIVRVKKVGLQNVVELK